MSKFFNIFFKMFLIAVIIYCLYSIIIVVASWNYKPEDQIINNPILSGIETVILGSEKELPSESSFGKAKVFITFREDVLKVWLFNPKVSKCFLCQEIEVRPSGYLSREKSWLLFVAPLDFYIKSVSLKENLLEIKLGISKGFDKFQLVLLVCMAGLMAVLLKSLTKKQNKKVLS
ncbi:MAG: hypothetical protein NT012_02545 [Candidatus Nealsonbacteria bacterium]|nr:hypothetical protein [Candidatus Nealsonbacteria bacterium]